MKVIPLFVNEKKLVQRALSGDRKAQKRLYDIYAPKMLGVCRKYVAPIQIAEELLLNGFYKVFTRLHDYNGTGSFEGWVRRIMVHECLDHLRKKDPFKHARPVDDLPLAQEEEDLLETLPLDKIQECIDNLPDGYRAVFVLHALDGHRHQDIAQMLGITTSTSKTQYRKARLLLQQLVRAVNQDCYELR